MDGTSFKDLTAVSGVATSMGAEVAHHIGRDIATSRYVPGSLIEDEAALSTRFGVSRSVVRDAVKVLVGKGLLDVRRGIGTRVKPREQWALLDVDVLAWQLSAQADSDMLLQLMEVRQLFEPQAAAWAARRARSSELADILEAVDAMSANETNMELFLKADARFHRSVLCAAHNEFLLALSGIIYSSLLASVRLHNPDVDNNRRIVPFHRDVYKAIADRDDTGAKFGMTFLIEDASTRIRNLMLAVS